MSDIDLAGLEIYLSDEAYIMLIDWAISKPTPLDCIRKRLGIKDVIIMSNEKEIEVQKTTEAKPQPKKLLLIDSAPEAVLIQDDSDKGLLSERLR